jgi:hypothetical protein
MNTAASSSSLACPHVASTARNYIAGPWCPFAAPFADAGPKLNVVNQISASPPGLAAQISLISNAAPMSPTSRSRLEADHSGRFNVVRREAEVSWILCG